MLCELAPTRVAVAADLTVVALLKLVQRHLAEVLVCDRNAVSGSSCGIIGWG